MLSYLLKNPLFTKFQVDRFTKDDYKTMCMLTKHKFPIYNQSIILNKQVKLVDEEGRLVGKYQASQARKKAYNLKKDIILKNKQSTPAICKLSSFRTDVIQTFYNQIVVKRNQSILMKVSQTKQVKLNLNSTQNQLKIKAKQIIQLSKKNLKIRIYLRCKTDDIDQGLSKLDFLKSQIQNKCFVDEDISYKQDDEEEEEAQQKNKKILKTISIVIKSRNNEFMELLNQTKADSPQQTIASFLKRYHKQQDVDMMDLKTTQSLAQQRLTQNVAVVDEKKQQKKDNLNLSQLQQKRLDQVNIKKQQYQKQRQAKARILKYRIETILRV